MTKMNQLWCQTSVIASPQAEAGEARTELKLIYIARPCAQSKQANQQNRTANIKEWLPRVFMGQTHTCAHSNRFPKKRTQGRGAGLRLEEGREGLGLM